MDKGSSIPSGMPAPTARSYERIALTVCAVVVLALLLYRGYGAGHRVQPTQQTVAKTPLDVNTADRTELLQIPGVGPSLADAILTHRSTFGPFQSLDELDAVHGIGGKTLDKLRPWLAIDPKAEVNSGAKPPEPMIERLEWVAPSSKAVGPAMPSSPITQPSKLSPNQTIDINTATVEELQQLPGIGPKLAERIVAVRAKGAFTSVDDLRRVSGIGAKTIDKLRPFVTPIRP